MATETRPGRPPNEAVPRSSRVQSVDRAMALLRAVAAASGTETSASNLADSCGLNRATAWRILTTLEAHGMVTCDRVSGQWSIGMAVVELAGATGIDGLIAAAHGVLERLSLQTGETADLAVVRAGGLTYVDEVAPASIVTAKWLGRSVPLHATSTGKALLAFLSDKEVDRLLPSRLEAHTDTTTTNRKALRDELALTRERGYGTCRGELEASLNGVSAPALDRDGRPLAVISIWGPSERVTEARLPILGQLVVDAAMEITRLRAGDSTPRV